MNKKINMFLWWTFWVIYLEVIYKVFIFNNLLSTNTIIVLVFSVPFILLFGLLTSLFSEKINKIINYLLSIFFAIWFLAQIVYFNFYYSMYSIFSFTEGGTGQVFQFWTMILEVILRIWYIFVLVFIPLILLIVFRKKFSYEKIELRSVLVVQLCFVISLFFIVCSVKLDKSTYSLKRLINETHAPMLTINKTGLFTAEVFDLYRLIFGFDEKIYYSGIKNDGDYSKEEYNVLDLKLNDSSIDNYIKNTKPTNKNKYTGIFKGKNVIFLNVESFDEIAIDKDLTPTLYKMVNEGFKFNNYYQPLYPISTFDGEYMNLTGLIPKEGTWSLREASNNYMPYTFGNMYKNNGYNTYAYHNYVYNFYEREKVHPKLGMEYMACGNGLEKLMNCDNWPNSDLEMISSTIDLYSKNKPFAVYYMTVSGHLNYNFRENDMAIKNKDKVKDLKYSNKIKSYLAANLEVEYAVEKLVNVLEEKGILNDTVIVLSPDHFPYGLKCSELNEKSSNDRCDKFELYHTSLIIYNPEVEHVEINKVVSGIDINSTLYNLFGFKYDSRLLMGKDIFSDEDHIVILSDRSWITDKGKYDSLKDEFIPFNNKGVNTNYVDKINKIVNERISISINMLNKDYYKEVGLDD